jgi:ABC-type multidrug transport system fused ATPase/permease subunit
MSRIDSIIDELPNIVSGTFFVVNESNRFVVDKINYHSLETCQGHLQISNLYFSYPNSPPLFSNFSLEVKPGERVGIMGQTGKGKTSLLKLFLRFYKPNEGVLYLDGKDIQTLNPDDVRKNICYINQRTSLFHTSIAKNISYGTTASEEDVYLILKKYNLLQVFHPDLSDDRACLSLQVQTNGSNISMGMQKVIFLVRGMLSKAPIYFIDEPFTSIDQATRSFVQHMIDVETRGKTVLVITHDTKGLDEVLDRMISL